MTVRLNRTTAQIKHLFSALTSRTVNCRRLLVLTACLVTLISVLAPVAFAQAQVFKGHQWSVSDNCKSCHIGDAAIKFRHARVGFFAAKHGQVKCGRCHANNKFALSRTKCRSCHRPSHRSSYALGIAGGCNRCHTVRAWRPAKRVHVNKLSAAHTKLRCAACHKSGVYTGLTWACASCHSLKHSASYSRGCGACHTQTAWKPATMNHAAVTGACSGCHTRPAAHAAGACSQCHATTAWKPASGAHTISLTGVHTVLACASCHKSNVYTGLTWTCTSCHAVQHSANYSTTCTTCHTQTAWRPATMNHAGTSGACSGCHTTPAGHSAGVCSQCHANTTDWSITLYVHPKVGEHTSKSFACSKCHPSGYATNTCLSCHKNGAP